MRTFLYEVIQDKSRQNGDPITRIYIYAKPRFSHSEMLSKQEQILDRLTDPTCPLEGAFQLAVAKDMSISSLCIARIDHLDRVKKTISFGFVHSLEIVVFNPLDVSIFIKWLSSIWKGEWKGYSGNIQ